ncbi:IS630 family transposase [Clostridium beijerinckii]|uniref:Transposase n=1 Tax=Clostridium beijerinckii TaxID=1520 RepID=A0AAX0B1N6_CLOBE|nr:IS630 family transposase [Clostridium beijerinckii]MBA8936859.1 transposase [Clostridium beijerinckii]NRT33619.1 transposase [Clostridium beijerinckii]NRT46952.1 transposase [Clostridium beijerinckii]NRT89092.1 transposase [Clostridium beijerinckii]NRU40676.1 transposase [Clostridium beijerinckii]
MRTLLHTVENSSDTVLYALDETGLRTESDIRRTWSKVGVSPVLESNNSHEGLNLIGATEISKKFDTIIDAYSAQHSIKSHEVEVFLERLLDANPGKKVYVLLDNAKFHTSKEIQDFANAHSEELFLINTPRYSPKLNPQENIWNKLKSCIFSPSAFPSIDDLFSSVSWIYDCFNDDTNMVKSLAYARNYY